MLKRFRFILMFFCLLFVYSGSHAQQYGHYTQYMLNKYQSNPAYGGLEKSLSIHAANRSQWSKLTRNPSQQHISAHMPVYLLQGGVGIMFENDQIGVEQTTNFQLSYNYVLQSQYGLLSAGASLGFIRKQLDGTAILTPDGTYEGPVISHNDPELSENAVFGSTAVWSVGIYYAHRLVEGGFSILNLPAHSASLDFTNIQLNPRYQLFLETHLKPWNYDVILRPSLQILGNGNSTQVTTSCLAEFGNVFAGIGLRGYSQHSVDGLNIILGTQLNNHLRITYSYDYGLNSLQTVSEGSHELGINYNLRKVISWGLPPKVSYNPRHL